VHLFGPSLSFLAEAQSRLETGEDKRYFLAEVRIKFFITGKITNLFCTYLPFSNI
jgi:hypothetical protein